jgi:hypothetical protein
MLIIRACHLLFALVESGGLLKGAPEEEILKLRINVIEARSGFVQPTLLAEQTSADEGQAIEETEEPDAEQISNPNSFSRIASRRRSIFLPAPDICARQTLDARSGGFIERRFVS